MNFKDEFFKPLKIEKHWLVCYFKKKCFVYILMYLKILEYLKYKLTFIRSENLTLKPSSAFTFFLQTLIISVSTY